MSSEVGIGAGIVMIPLAAPLAAAAVAGAAVTAAAGVVVGAARGLIWLNNAVSDVEKKTAERLAEEERVRSENALAGRERLRKICADARTELERKAVTAPVSEFDDISELRQTLGELESMCASEGSTDEVENTNMLLLTGLDRVFGKLRKIDASAEAYELRYEGYAVADILDDMRLEFAFARIRKTQTRLDASVDVDAYERKELLKRLDAVKEKICGALAFTAEYAQTVGLDNKRRIFIGETLAGVDKAVLRLYDTADPKKLRHGIRNLEDRMEIFSLVYPDLKKELAVFEAYYGQYVKLAEALNEKPAGARRFAGPEEIETEILRLNKKAERAEKCRKIYEKLGPEAYVFFAWETELKAMGYKVFSDTEVEDLADWKLTHAVINGKKTPLLSWIKEGETTEIFRVAGDCALQMIMHRDGSSSMRTISVSGDVKNTEAVREKHCAQMKEIYARLYENWFIKCDGEEKKSAAESCTAAEWRNEIRAGGAVSAEAGNVGQLVSGQKKTQTGQTAKKG